MPLAYHRADPIRLRDLGFDEKWLQDRINEDPSVLGLGDLVVITREHTQPSGGRIDFLMYDPEDGVRYEIEVMLGRLDETHIIRTLEYWDVERKRFPSLQHRAVIVAEEITNRFFNIIALFNQAIPIIAIQLNAFRVDERVVLHFTTVLDLPEPEPDDEGVSGEKVDRTYWEKRSNASSMRILDRMISLVPTGSGPVRVTYNKYHVAVGSSGQNFLWLHPRKNASHLHMHLRIEGPERAAFLQELETAGIFSGPRGKEVKMRLSEAELKTHEELIRRFLASCEEQSRA
jgi:hypothetical protein